jgi:hypothetical protein
MLQQACPLPGLPVAEIGGGIPSRTRTWRPSAQTLYGQRFGSLGVFASSDQLSQELRSDLNQEGMLHQE